MFCSPESVILLFESRIKFNTNKEIMKKTIILIMVALVAALPSFAQVVNEKGQIVDTTDIYGERADSLNAAVFVSRQAGNFLSKGKEIRTEVISAAGLCKMACCNLAESFENSASVTVGFSDAVTGARQIRLLGLSGVYTQMLDETRPVMRGLSAPFGLSYVPGQWLESIQIAKGASSVINGVECMTGQINMEHRKPTDEKPLFINGAVMSDSKLDLNVASSLQMGYKWSTVILAHISGNTKPHDMNNDSFLDDPKMLQLNLSNRWLYQADNGMQIRFGVRALQDSRLGGQMLKNAQGENVFYDHERYSLTQTSSNPDPWGSDILNRSINGYFKIGVPLNEENSQNIALVADYNYQDMDSYFGSTMYVADQHSAFANLLYQNEINESHKFTLGLNATIDRYDENFERIVMIAEPLKSNGITNLSNYGAFGEYTYHIGEEFSAIAGLRADYFPGQGFKVSPRMTLKYMPIDEIVIRANGGRGLRYSTPLVDNIGVFSTGKEFVGSFNEHILEDAWTFGGNLTYYFPISSNSYLSFDYFRTQFAQQMVVDYERGMNQINFYALDGKRSYTDNYQLDFSIDPFERFNITTTFRYTNAKIELAGQGLVEKPMTSRFKGVLNMQYATNLNKWIFDFTASVNGSCRVYNFMENLVGSDGELLYEDGRTPVYPLLYAQVTRRFKGWDVYIGAENLTNFRQTNVILGTKGSDGYVNPRVPSFDASCIWGPLMGIKAHVGFRFTLWKTV